MSTCQHPAELLAFNTEQVGDGQRRVLPGMTCGLCGETVTEDELLRLALEDSPHAQA